MKKILLFIIICCSTLAVQADVILMWTDVILNGKINTITYYKKDGEKTLKGVQIRTAEADLDIKGKHIVQFWVTQNAEEDIAIYENLNRPLSEEAKQNIRKQSFYLETQSPEVITLEEKKTFKTDLGQKWKQELNTLNKIGTILLPVSSIVFTTGISLLLYDTIGYFPIVKEYKTNYQRGQSRQAQYLAYTTAYHTNMVLFATSISLTAIGLIGTIISIPFLIYKKKAILSFGTDYHQTFCISVRIPFRT